MILQPASCPKCGGEIPDESPFGLCPCALGDALAVDETVREGAPPGTSALPRTETRSGSAETLPANLREIGPYRIVRKLGEGGFGDVYLAWQQRPVQREVAVKVLKPGIDSRHVSVRFAAERRTLARLEHPNISTIYDAGETNDGLPYFVMEYVNGINIRTFCQENRLTIDERIDLFKSVCRAVHHAHQKGIIHRDLKPANILVFEDDGVPIPKVIDFGIAKALSDDGTVRTMMATKANQVLGTLAYMSPEQASGSKDIDVRSDIYSLGAVLYELFTGTSPFSRKQLRGRSFVEILGLINDVMPPLPSRRATRRESRQLTVPPTGHRLIAKVLRGDLDSIVIKSLEKDRKARYQSAQELADDLGRYERNEPVPATRAGRIYLAKKFVRRYRPIVFASGCVLAALLIALAASSMMAWRAGEARELENAALQGLEESARGRAAAQAETDDLLSFAFDELYEPLAESGDVDLLEFFAHQAFDHYAKATVGPSQLDDRIKRARLFEQIGEVFSVLNKKEEAVRALSEALASLGNMEGETSAHELSVRLRIQRARALSSKGDHEAALEDLGMAKGQLSRAGSGDDLVRHREALELAFASVREKQEQFDDAIRHMEAAIVLREKQPDDLLELTNSRRQLANLQVLAGQSDKALAILDSAIQAARSQGDAALRGVAPLLLSVVRCLQLKGSIEQQSGSAVGRRTFEDALSLLTSRSVMSEEGPGIAD